MKKKMGFMRRISPGRAIAAALLVLLIAVALATGVKYKAAVNAGKDCAQMLQSAYAQFGDMIALGRLMNSDAAQGNVDEFELSRYRDFCGRDNAGAWMDPFAAGEIQYAVQIYNYLGGAADPALCTMLVEYVSVRAEYYQPMMALLGVLLEDEEQFGGELRMFSSLLADTLAADETIGMLLYHRALRSSFGLKNLRSSKRFEALRESMTQEELYVLLCLSDITFEEHYQLKVKELGRCEAHLEDCFNRIVLIQEPEGFEPIRTQKVHNMITYSHDLVSEEAMRAGSESVWY